MFPSYESVLHLVQMFYGLLERFASYIHCSFHDCYSEIRYCLFLADHALQHLMPEQILVASRSNFAYFQIKFVMVAAV